MMRQKRLFSIPILLLALLSCGEEMTDDEFCAESSKIICEKIYEGGCFTEDEKLVFENRDKCEELQNGYCAGRSEAEESKFDANAASLCLNELKKMQCKPFKQGKYAGCSDVFGDASPSYIEESEPDEE
ncbi:MAG: hypothetical protein Kow0090_14520 [Myxococcota bacterium]